MAAEAPRPSPVHFKEKPRAIRWECIDLARTLRPQGKSYALSGFSIIAQK
jgi:hypothetical protein